jgi:thiosulfate/3-mercaptopyruvate sulfurtransferase
MKAQRAVFRGMKAAMVVLFLLGAFLALSSEGNSAQANSCLECHSNAGRILSLAQPPEDNGGSCGSAPDRPYFLNFFVNRTFPDSFHGRLGCTTCHRGVATGGAVTADDMKNAHQDMIDPTTSCQSCHATIVASHQTSIHHTLAGQDKALMLRSGQENFDRLHTMRSLDCNTCHAGCGDCHVSIPQGVGGGLIQGHAFFKKPPMKETCAACHGTRAGGEFLGAVSESLPADVHFTRGMECVSCHQESLHGDGTIYDNRWSVQGLPDCANCHRRVPDTSSSVLAHQIPKHQSVSCQVCHAVAYNNCFACHSYIDDKGTYHRTPGEKLAMFKIGRNTVPGYSYSYVPVRHNPVDRQAFDFFGENLLPFFDDVPNWRTAAPHNIQRVTPQNRSCDSCHGNRTLFLTRDDLDPADARANEQVVVDRVP